MPTRVYGQIIELELIEELKKIHKPKKQFAYQIDVTWTDSSTRRVYRFSLTFLSQVRHKTLSEVTYSSAS